MSIALMTDAWKLDMPSGQKFVLLSLCDNANDQGECYPSISMIATRCSMAVRTVQTHISWLEEAGYLRRVERAGRSTVYQIDPRRFCTPADSAPPQKLHPTPAGSAPPPPQILHPTPADSAPRTINEPSIEPKGNRQKSAVAPAVPDVPAELLADYLRLRSARKAGPLTDTALAGLRREAAAAGMTLAQAITVCCERSWTGFKAEWVRRDESAPRRQPAAAAGRYAGAAAAIFDDEPRRDFIDA